MSRMSDAQDIYLAIRSDLGERFVGSTVFSMRESLVDDAGHSDDLITIKGATEGDPHVLKTRGRNKKEDGCWPVLTPYGLMNPQDYTTAKRVARYQPCQCPL